MEGQQGDHEHAECDHQSDSLIDCHGITSLNKLMFSPFFSRFRMFSSLTSEAPLDNI